MFTTIRDLLSMWRYDVHVERGLFMKGRFRAAATATYWLAKNARSRFICARKGHDIEGALYAADEGGEILECRRCGWSETVWH